MREQRADYRAAVLAGYLSQSRNFRAEKHFPSLAGGAGGGGTNRWEIEEIPEEWVQIKGDEAEQWMVALNLDRMSKR